MTFATVIDINMSPKEYTLVERERVRERAKGRGRGEMRGDERREDEREEEGLEREERKRASIATCSLTFHS